ncbi:MAG: MoaD/ThiS family protein [Hyphomicrobiales bacterium]|nr:MoaD/ThiS family protein [Hyphomicrobiales bacterium]
MSTRWDAVVDPAAGRLPPAPVVSVPLRSLTGTIAVEVRLFGALASTCATRTVRLELPPQATIADVFAGLCRELGESFLANLVDESGAKRRHCRLFVGGYAVEDVSTPLAATADPSNIEIILLVAPEGG